MRIVKDEAYFLRCEDALRAVAQPFPLTQSFHSRVVEIGDLARKTLDSQFVPSTVSERISEYLRGGGLFNPELAEHTAVRDLLIDCQTYIAELKHRLNEK